MNEQFDQPYSNGKQKHFTNRDHHRGNNYHHHHRGPYTAPVQAPSGPQLTLEEAQAVITPLKLFSAYHLGVTENNRYHLVSVPEVARRFNTSPATIDTLLTQYHLTKEDFKQIKGFDLGLARLDIEVAPEGISREEVAKQIFEEFKLG